jgi:surface antigen
MNFGIGLLSLSTLNKQICIAVTIIIILIILPCIALLSLGSSTLKLLSLIPGTASAEKAIGLYQGPSVGGDTYAWGNCTYWVYYLRKQANDPIPTSWGNAATWAVRAQQDGYTVNKIPAVGSIMQISDVANGLGHVAYVTSIDPSNGAWTISEMNVKGLDIVDAKTYSAVDETDFNFIHDKASI